MEGVPRVETKKPEEARVTKDIINQVQRLKIYRFFRLLNRRRQNPGDYFVTRNNNIQHGCAFQGVTDLISIDQIGAPNIESGAIISLYQVIEKRKWSSSFRSKLIKH
jgi:hypothetical protein